MEKGIFVPIAAATAHLKTQYSYVRSFSTKCDHWTKQTFKFKVV